MNKTKKIIKPVIIIILAVIAYFIISGLEVSSYIQMIINMALIYSLISYSISVLLGMGGELSFASVSFMGGGAFLIANLTTGRLGVKLTTTQAFLLIIPVFIVIGFILGLMLLRLKGTFFSFGTIALVQVTYSFFNNYKPLFGGADGISGIPTTEILGTPMKQYADWFPYLLAFSILIGFIVERIRKTQLGRSLASIRDNELAARTLGVNVYLTKVIAFTIAGVLAALAGGLYAMHTKFVSSDMFTYQMSTQYVIMAMLGGVQSTAGSFFGAIIVQTLPQLLRDFERYFQLFWGVAIILLMVFMPDGLAGLVKKIWRKIRHKKTVFEQLQEEQKEEEKLER